MRLVVGATGLLGREICQRLRERGDAVRALVRASSDPDTVASLAALGAETVVGDLQDPASLARACAGVDTVISTASATISRQAHDSLIATDLEGQLSLLEAAKAAGVRQYVYVSYSGNIEVDSPLHRAKRTVEQRLRESGLAYTILRPSVFMEIWLSPHAGFDAANRKAQIMGPGTEPISYISLRDVAKFAALVTGNPKAENRTLELGGPEALAPEEVVRIFEEERGGAFEVTNVPAEALHAHYESATDDLQKSLAALAIGISNGDRIDMSLTLREFPVRMTTLREFARGR
jgi:NADH dehydrogenase